MASIGPLRIPRSIASQRAAGAPRALAAIVGAILAVGMVAPALATAASSVPAPSAVRAAPGPVAAQATTATTGIAPSAACLPGELHITQGAETVPAIVPTALNVLKDVTCPGAATPSRPLTFALEAQALIGTVTTDGTTFVYNPSGCKSGTDFFKYSVSDGVTTLHGKFHTVTIARPAAAPVTDLPQVGFVSGGTMGSTVPMRISWCGVTAPGAALKAYRVVQSTNGGATWPSTIIGATTATSNNRSLSVGTAYRFGVRTADTKGRTGAFVRSLTSRITRYQENSGSIAYSAGWKSTSSTHYSGGKERYVARAGATATLTVTNVRAFAIVATRATGRGSFYVYVDGTRVATISEKASKTAYRRILYTGSLSSAAGVTHRIQVRSVSRTRIDLDAILTLSGKQNQAVTFNPATPPAAVVSNPDYAVASASTSTLPVTLSVTQASWGACALTGGAVSFHGKGTCTLRATQPGDQTWNAASAQQVITVAGRPQVISFATLPARRYGDAPFAVAATGGASGKPVTFASQTTTVCTAAPAGTVTIVAAGTCTIRASQAGTSAFADATPVARTFTVAAKPLTVIGISARDRAYDRSTTAILDTVLASLVGSQSGDDVGLGTTGATGSFTDANVGVGKIVRIAGLTLTGTDRSNYVLTAPTAIASIRKADQLIHLTSLAPNPAIKGGSTYTVAAHADSGLPVTFGVASGSAGVCTIAGAVVSFIDPGTCVVTAAQAGDGNWNPASPVQQSITVAATGSRPQAITFDPLGDVTYGDAPVALVVSTNSTLAITLTPETPAVCTVAGSVATIIGAGTCAITASQPGNTEFAPATPVTESFTVGPKGLTVTGVTATSRPYDGSTVATLGTGSAALVGVIGTDDVTLDRTGATGTFVPDANVGANKTVTVAGLSLGGTKAGSYSLAAPTTTASITKATVTVTAANKAIVYGSPDPAFTFAYGPFVNGESAAVVGTAPGCAVAGPHATVPGSPYPITCSGGLDGNYRFTYVDGALSISPKPLAVSFTAASRTYDATTAATITSCSVSASDVVADDTVSCAFTSASARFATELAGPGKTVTGSGFTLAGGDAANYGVGTVNTTTATVFKASPACTITPYDVAYDGVAHTASGSCLGVVSEPLTGLALAGTTHTAAGAYASDPWTFTDETGNYSDDAGTVSDTIRKADQAITFTSTAPGAATVGGTTYTVAATVPSGLPVTFSIDPASAGVCSISGGNVVHFNDVGTCTIDADQGGDANHLAAPQVAQDVPVGLGAQTISFDLSAVSKTYGDDPFGVTATATSGLTVTFGSQSTAVCTVAGSTVTIVAAGNCTVRASQAGGGGFSPAPTVDQSFLVDKRAIAVTAVTDTRVADGTTASDGIPTRTAGTLAPGDTAAWTQAFTTETAGTGKTISPAGTVHHGATVVTGSYSITFVADTSGVITPAAASAATSTISANPASIPADGASTSTLTVQLKDAFGNDLLASGGGTVVLAASAGSIGDLSDNGDGTWTATYTSDTTPGPVAITGTLEGVDLAHGETITLT